MAFLVKKLEIARHLMVKKLERMESWNCLVVNSEFVVVDEDLAEKMLVFERR